MDKSNGENEFDFSLHYYLLYIAKLNIKNGVRYLFVRNVEVIPSICRNNKKHIEKLFRKICDNGSTNGIQRMITNTNYRKYIRNIVVLRTALDILLTTSNKLQLVKIEIVNDAIKELSKGNN